MSQRKAGPRLSEDWLATIVGLIIVAAIGVGLLGPGAQTVALSAEPGATVEADALAAAGWTIRAQIGETAVPVDGAPATLESGASLEFVCEADTITAGNGAPVENDQVVLSLVNHCAAPVTLTYSRPAALPWPLSKSLGR
jgi:hypothetical protein